MTCGFTFFLFSNPHFCFGWLWNHSKLPLHKNAFKINAYYNFNRNVFEGRQVFNLFFKVTVFIFLRKPTCNAFGYSEKAMV